MSKVYISIESIDNGFIVQLSDYADEFGGAPQQVRYAVRDAEELLDSLEAALISDEFDEPLDS